MARFLKKTIVLTVLLLVGGSYYYLNYLSTFIMGLKKSHKSFPKDLSSNTERLRSKVSWVDEGNYLPLNVSYQLLAGEASTQNRYLAIGLSSVKRIRGSYLIATLQSLFSHSSPEERSSMVVVVLLADFDTSWRANTVKEIKTSFASELKQGQLLVIHVSPDWYPPLKGLKRNYNDPPDRVTFRSKQNVDYSFLMHYSIGLSEYYLQVEDDISCAQNFLSQIKRHIEDQEAKKTNWAVLEFSVLGYIGKLYRSAHLPLLSRFLFIFYQEMPCDWLMSHFRELLTQKEPIILKPSLFQHMGSFSSFKGGYNKLKDNDFQEEINTNPAAEVFSDMAPYQDKVPKLAWSSSEDFFWTRDPYEGNYMTVVLTDPKILTSILVETGLDGRDILESGQVELGHNVVTTSKEKSCEEFLSIGTLEKGRFEVHEVDKRYNTSSSCVRIRVTAKQTNWLVIRNIRVTTK